MRCLRTDVASPASQVPLEPDTGPGYLQEPWQRKYLVRNLLASLTSTPIKAPPGNLKPSQKNAKTSHQTRVQQEPANERRVTETRAARTGVLHNLTRAIQMLSAQVRRAHKAEAAVQTQNEATSKSIDQQLGYIIKVVLSGHLFTAQRAGEKVTQALSESTPGAQQSPQAIFTACAARVPLLLVNLTVDELATLDARLDKVLMEALKEDAEAAKKQKPPSSLAIQQMSVSVKSALLNCKMRVMGFDEPGWSIRPKTMFVMKRIDLLQRKELFGLADPIFTRAYGDQSPQAARVLTGYDKAYLEEIQAYGKAALDEFNRRAILSVEKADPGKFADLEVNDLEEIKQNVDWLSQRGEKNPNTQFEMGAIRDAADAQIKNMEKQLAERLPGKSVAEQATSAAIDDGRKLEAKAAFKASLQTAVRQARAANGAQALMDFLTKAREADVLLTSLKQTRQTTETNNWIQEMLDQELVRGASAELKALQRSLNAGAGKRILDHMSAREDGIVGPVTQLRSALNAMFPESGSSPTKKA